MTLGVLVILAVVVLLRLWKGEPLLGGNRIDLAYLPEDTVLVQYVNLENEAAVDNLFPSFQAAGYQEVAEKLTESSGLRIEDIQSIVMGFRSDRTNFNTEDGIEFVGVARSNTDYDVETIRNWLGAHDTVEHGGEVLYQFGTHAIFFPDPQTLVFGATGEVRAAVGRKTYRLSAFDVINPNDVFSQAVDLRADGLSAVNQRRQDSLPGVRAYATGSGFEDGEWVHAERVLFSNVAQAKAHMPPNVVSEFETWTEGAVAVLTGRSLSGTKAQFTSFQFMAQLANASFDPLNRIIKYLADEKTHQLGANSLATIGSKVHPRRREEVMQKLLPLLNSENRSLRSSAIRAYAQVGGVRTIPKLFDFCDDNQDRFAVMLVLKSMGSQAVPELIDAIDDPRPEVVNTICGTLADLADEETLANLSKQVWPDMPAMDGGYLPADTKFVHFIRMADAMQQASFSSQPSDVQSMMDKASERTGIPFDIVETITIGYPESAAESIRQAPYGNMIVTREPIDFVAVIRCLESFDEDKLLEFLKSPEKASHRGKNYYSVDGQRGVFVADSQTLVVGTISELHAAIESEGKSHPIEIFNSVDPSFHITFLMDFGGV